MTSLSRLLRSSFHAVMCALAVFVSGCGRPAAPPSLPPVKPPETPAAPERQPLPRLLDPLRLSKDRRGAPGVDEASTVVRYQCATSDVVYVAGSWDGWSSRVPLERKFGLWEFDVRPLALSFGRYEYKFLPDRQWEPGPNRVLYANSDGMFERPPDLVFSARLEAPSRVDVLFRQNVDPDKACAVRFDPPVEIDEVRWSDDTDRRDLPGYAIAGEYIRFLFDERVYGVAVSSRSRVSVAGTFNGWRADAGEQWQLSDPDDDGRWDATLPLGLVRPHGDAQDVLFKFVVDGSRWLSPPSDAPNALADGKGNTNLRLDPNLSKAGVLEIHTSSPLSLTNSHIVVFDELADRTVWTYVTPGRVFDGIRSDSELGVVLDDHGGATFRLFAPRASSVRLWLFPSPYLPAFPTGAVPSDVQCLAMSPSGNGTWEQSVPALPDPSYYAFSLDGPDGPGETFNASVFFGGPRARAVAHATHAAIVIDPDAVNQWFGGWTDQDYKAPAWQDMVIYETHVRHFTVDPSSGVTPAARGRYSGVLETRGSGLGLDHLKALGVNMIEFMPVSEYENGTNEHQWGYAPAYYFAPEASFGQKPLEGSHYYEFKHLVNELHRGGLGVILDVVYNHVGYPNVFDAIDRKYYFRMDQDFELSNFSGCGNDVRTESPMMRKFIIDNVLYWMREHHVDGFRFDLAELIDMDTLMAVRAAARRENPNVILISEPWSFRGDHKYQLTGTGWAAWNNEFRDGMRDFIRGGRDIDYLKKLIAGSVETWTATPLQSVNYLESHDDRCLADELTFNRGHDGRRLSEADAARHRLGATLLFTSLGIPMLSEGQEFMRSKHGIHNTFDRGDAINALRWTDRDRPIAASLLSMYQSLAAMRQSARGASFRCRDKPPADYFTWLPTGSPRAIGFLVNARRQLPGAPFAVLVNADDRPTTFSVPPRYGPWRLVGNGREVDMSGVPRGALSPVNTDSGRVNVPRMTALIYCGV